ncbi:MAG: S8 family peptidase [Pseudomonadota bacterium]
MRRSDGPEFHGAPTVWEDGFTGAGEIIAVIDSGLDSDSPEFAGRVHPDSADVAGNRGIDPENDHGTNVALVAAAGRNDEGVIGQAFGADVLAIRADLPGTCGVDTPQDPSLGCRFADNDIATGVDLAIAAGATVINLSLGGGAANDSLRAALSRAADAGVVVVIAAGNAGDGSDPDIPPDQPDPFAVDAVNAGNGNVIIVGSVDDESNFSDFSNRAGDFANSFLTARGERICCVYENGEIFVENVGGQEFVTLFSGTSFATPQVAGAVALLAEAFPNLEATEIVEILLDSARDAGEAGTDTTFGTGILDIGAAFQPNGTTTLAGTDFALGFASDFALGSAAMGDALNSAQISTIVLDRFDRAYNVELGAEATQNAAQVQRLRGAVERGVITRSARVPGFSASVTIGEGTRAGGLNWESELQLTSDEALGARVLAARVAAQIAPDTQVGLAILQGGKGLVRELQGQGGAAFSIAPNAGGDTGFTDSSEVALAVRQRVGEWGLTVAAERGQAWLAGDRPFDSVVDGSQINRQEQRPTATFSVAADRQFGALNASVGVSWLSERETMLGGHFNPSLGFRGADTMFLDGDLSRRFGAWRVGGAVRYGITRPRGSAQIADGSRLTSEAWSFDISRGNVFGYGHTLGVRVSQPLRVSGSEFALNLPVAFDYATETPILGRQSLSLSPEGREIMSELAWAAPVFGGYARASAFHRRQPGHFATSPDDVGGLVSFSASF